MARQKKRSDGYFKRTFTFDGKRYSVYAKTQAELSDKVIEKRKRLEAGIENVYNPTIREYYEKFTDARRDGVIKEATIRGQIYQFKNIADAKMADGVRFGDLRIRSITRQQILDVRKTLLTEGKKPEYLNIIFAHLNHVFECAIKVNLIEKNPCRALEKLRRETRPISETKHRALSEEETIKFLKTAESRNSYFTNLFKVMLLTGMRIGEASALYLTDIDEKYIHIRRSVTRDEAGCYIVGQDAKTKTSQRDLKLQPDVKEAFKNQIRQNELIFGSAWCGTIFQSPDGKLLREYTVNREIKRICKQAEIDLFTCHAFRATFATRCMEQSPEEYMELAKIMGHKDVSITLNVYAKVMKDREDAFMDKIKIRTS